MTLPRETVLRGIHGELTDFAELLATLSTADLERPTRCAGWTVGHVAGHVVGTAVDVTSGRLEALGAAAVNERQARDRVGRSPLQLADELRAAIATLDLLLASIPPDSWHLPALSNPEFSTAFAVEAIWYDAFVHADDIRTALGVESARGEGLVCAVQHLLGYLSQQGRSLSLELDGLERIDVGGGGERITGDPLTFVLVATGREDPAIFGLDSWINVYGG